MPLRKPLNKSEIITNHIPVGRVEVQNADGDKREVKMEAYSGAPVDLWDYGWDDPVVYNVATMKVKEKVPFLYDHYEAIGHGKIELNETKVDAVGVLLTKNETATEIWEALNEEFPYEASLGLRFKYSDISYYAEGKTVVVNGQTLEGPIYVVDNSIVKESSVVKFGRDSNTSVVKMSEERLMTIKNSAGGKIEKPPVKKQRRTVTNSTPPGTVSKQDMLHAVQLMAKFPKHVDLVKEALNNGWTEDQLQDKVDLIELRELKKNLPSVPTVETKNKQEEEILIRMSSILGCSEEFLNKKFEKATVSNALNKGLVSFKEIIVMAANSAGGRFTGHTDIEAACRYFKQHCVNNTDRFSTIDFPNLMHQVAVLRVEQAWTIAEPFATKMLFVDNKSDFKTTRRLRPSGGQMWERLDKDGKIKHGSMGTEKLYAADLDTIAQILTFPRDMVINDDIGYIDQILTLMVDGARMVPDFEFVNKIYQGEDSGFLVEGQNLMKGAGNALSEATLETAYQLARSTSITKGNRTVKGRFGDKYVLVVSAALERLAWQLTRPTVMVEGDVGDLAAGAANYYFGKIRPMTFEQLGNDTYHPDANDSTWMLIPEERLYAPWSISYLNGQSRPITEVVSMPADMLGFGVRGYWDLNINEREDEAVVVVIPSQASGLSTKISTETSPTEGLTETPVDNGPSRTVFGK